MKTEDEKNRSHIKSTSCVHPVVVVAHEPDRASGVTNNQWNRLNNFSGLQKWLELQGLILFILINYIVG